MQDLERCSFGPLFAQTLEPCRNQVNPGGECWALEHSCFSWTSEQLQTLPAHSVMFCSTLELSHIHIVPLHISAPRPSATIPSPLPRSSSMLSAMPSGMHKSWRSSRYKKNWMLKRSDWIRWWKWSGRNPCRGRRNGTRREERKEYGKGVVWASPSRSCFHACLGPCNLAKNGDES